MILDSLVPGDISIHALLAEGDVLGFNGLPDDVDISIHALLAEGDCSMATSKRPADGFQSTPSSRRATLFFIGNEGLSLLISIHALLAEGDESGFIHMATNRISIHALLAEGDTEETTQWRPVPAISIHALLAEGDAVL